jgi:site-specific DNA-methyltransferase (adenine-specific)
MSLLVGVEMKSETFNIDCMVGMAQYPDKYFDLAVVDPPYGMPKDSTHGRGKLKNRVLNNGGVERWDTKPTDEYFTELFRISKNQIIWGGNYFGLPATRGFVIWDKEQPFENFSAAEYAWMSFQTTSKIFRLAATRTGDIDKFHPTQKPVKLYSWIFHNYAKPTDKILDTHLGSGSSRIAAHKAGLDFTGYELDRDYFEAQEKRYKQFISQLTLF